MYFVRTVKSGLQKPNMRALHTQRVDQLKPGGLGSIQRPVMLHACRKPVNYDVVDSEPDPKSNCDLLRLKQPLLQQHTFIPLK